MSVEDEETYQSSNKCWICNKLFTENYKKVRDLDKVTTKHRGSVHHDCNLRLTKRLLQRNNRKVL